MRTSIAPPAKGTRYQKVVGAEPIAIRPANGADSSTAMRPIAIVNRTMTAIASMSRVRVEKRAIWVLANW